MTILQSIPSAAPSPVPEGGLRTRTVSWQDPMLHVEAAKGLSGLEFLRSMVEGKLPPPPVAVVLGFGLVEVSEGRATFALQPGEHQYNPIGVVHGGVAATVLDSALGCAVQSTLKAGEGYTTVELHVNLVRAITQATPRLLCKAELIHAGGRMATAQARLEDAEGRLYAHATTTCMVFRPPNGGGRSNEGR